MFSSPIHSGLFKNTETDKPKEMFEPSGFDLSCPEFQYNDSTIEDDFNFIKFLRENSNPRECPRKLKAGKRKGESCGNPVYKLGICHRHYNKKYHILKN